MPEPKTQRLMLTMPLRFLLRLTFSLALVVTSFTAVAQDDEVSGPRRGSRVVDDTTKQIYGPNTSKYFFEEDIFFNRENFQPIDTLIRNFHRYNYVQRFGYRYQDLGNIGTAIRPIYYENPDVIGKRSGMHVYDLYTDTEQVKYYNTRSPYSNMKIVLGGLGRSITKGTYSRNITPNWNFGVNYRALLIDKNIQRRGKADRLVRGTYYDAYTTFQSKDSTYRLFANVRRNYHRVEEFGGVRNDLLPTGGVFSDTNYFQTTAQPWLNNAESNDLRSNYHLFHQYSLAKPLQVYHIIDRYRQRNKFFDIPATTTDAFFGNVIEIVSDTTENITKFKAVRNEAGVKGNIGKLFWNGYYAIRHYSMSYVSMRPDTGTHMTFDSLRFAHIGNEHYVGGRLSIFLDSIGEVRGGVEFMRDPDSTYLEKKYYRLYGQITSKWFDAKLTQMQYAPGFMEQAYRGSYNKWNNFFSNITSTQFNGHLHYTSKVLNVSPGLTFTRLSNYVFYKNVSDTSRRVMPIQSTGRQVIASPELNLSVTFFKHITLSGQGIYTELLENADSAMSIPKVLLNAQLAYSNIFFNGNFDIHTGVDVHWRSAYYAMGYDPALRQFYIQNGKNDEVRAHPIVDIFINAKVKRGRIFFKYHNLLQSPLFVGLGYMPTPTYPGQPNSFEFGFDWSFYD